MSKNKEDNIRIIEALIFASEKSINIKDLKNKLPHVKDLKNILYDLQKFYKNRGIILKEVDNAWYFETATDISDYLTQHKVVKKKLSKAAMETLSIIAYFQPITKPEIEEIRGVSSHSGIFEILFNNEWIETKGRKEVPGRPLLWHTTRDFLIYFNLNSIKDLPSKKELLDSGLLAKGDNLNLEILK
ncbi:MAG: SMC-Scp complex subunit ScpB [Pelagibacterales bacterium]|nr:SMC-Scp complex subunit ScpB [Pelagibacterales bacterium]OUU61969.1 MAG: SMC-Scp complex subunit ScpB [Alphaproteobacteria bacterium TMED62]|tara:strand:- start:10856 stop:11416 length:561 start_codon:yes stop_codon:yes gene_type:complete